MVTRLQPSRIAVITLRCALSLAKLRFIFSWKKKLFPQDENFPLQPVFTARNKRTNNYQVHQFEWLLAFLRSVQSRWKWMKIFILRGKTEKRMIRRKICQLKVRGKYRHFFPAPSWNLDGCKCSLSQNLLAKVASHNYCLSAISRCNDIKLAGENASQPWWCHLNGWGCWEKRQNFYKKTVFMWPCRGNRENLIILVCVVVHLGVTLSWN